MRKYVIKYTYKAYEDRKIDHSDLITGIACYGLTELKATLQNLKNEIGLQYIENDIDILTGDGKNAYSVGTKKINKIKL